MIIKVLLVEDEPGIRLVMRKIIQRQEGFEIVGECDHMTEAIKLFSKFKPDVVFLDVEINGGSGIECAKIVADIDPKAKIIFATAHTEYMSNAFEVYAFDYLVKPFDIERMNQTLRRIKVLYEEEDHQERDKIIRYEKGLDKLLVKGKESMSFVDMKDIVLVQREDKRTVIYTTHNQFSTSASLTEIQDKLDNNQFIRSHKSYIINLSQITKIYPYGRWTYIVKFKGIEQDALITHEKYEEIKKMFI